MVWKTLHTVLCVLLCTQAPLPAVAQETPSPIQIVTQLYAPYEGEVDLAKHTSALRLIHPHANEDLKTAIEGEEACQIREGGICSLDFDILINAQDWERSVFRISLENEDTEKATVAARFVSGKANTILIMFEKSLNEWKINDIQAIKYSNKMGGQAEATVSLKEILSRTALNYPAPQ